MDDEWGALEHYLLAKAGGAPEARAAPDEPATILLPVPAPELDEIVTVPAVTLGAGPARG
jgi:hypothetical protein